MNSEKFVDIIIKSRLRKSSIEGVIENLIKVSGRSPHKDDVEESQWYHGLNENDKLYLERIIGKTTDMALFGLLAMLDGVSLVAENGDYELYYIDKETKERILLNDPNDIELHALYNAVEE